MRFHGSVRCYLYADMGLLSMDWTIYSTGDGAFLAQILNAVAMFTNSGNLAALAGIGFLVGVIFAVIQAIIDGGRRLPFGGMAVAMVLYMAMFTPRVTVTVFDTYTWAGRQVDNVPLGVAAVGSVLSHVGYGITEFTEQYYTIPGMLSSGGYGTPLEMLLSVRNQGLGAANHIGPHDNFLQSMANYAKDCTEVGINLGFLDPAQIVVAPKVWQAIQFQSTLYTTKVFLPDGPAGGKKVTCDQAYTALSDQWGARLDAWNLVLSHRFNTTDARTIMQGALDNMVKVGLSADQYMKSVLTMNIVRRVDSGDYSPGMYTSALINTQATEQARVQFAGEASIFARFARPLMTFVEGFVYSLTPFMVFAIGLGMMGIKLVGRYILMLLWVQLWMPILSVVNLFIDMSFSHKMDALNSILLYNGDPLSALSMLGMNTMQNQVADWVAVGGNLVAAAPALALGIVYGGAYSLVNIANRLSPQDMIDEQQAAPNLMKNAGVLSMTQRATNDPLGGTRVTGTDDVLPNASIGTMASQAASSARAEMESSQSAYSSAVSQGISSFMKGGVSANKLRQLGTNVSHTQGTAFGNTIEQGQSLAEKYHFGADQKKDLQGLITATASGAIKPSVAKMLSTELGLSGKGVLLNNASRSQSFGNDLDSLFKEASSEQVRESFDKVVSATAQDGTGQSWETVAGEENSQKYNASLQRVQNASRSYNEAQSLSDSIGANQSIPLSALAESVSHNKGAMQYIRTHLAHDMDLDRHVQKRMAEMESHGPNGLFGDPRIEASENKYRAAAYFQEDMAQAFDGNHEAVRDMRVDGLRKVLQASGFVASGSVPGNLDPAANKDVAGSARANADDIAANAKVATDDARSQMGDAKARAEQAPGRIAGQKQRIPTTGEYQRQIDAQKAAAADRTSLNGVVGDAAFKPQLRHLEQAPKVPASAQLYGMATGIGDMFGLSMTPRKGGAPTSGTMAWYQKQWDDMKQTIAQRAGEQSGTDAGQAALQEKIERGMEDMHNGSYDRARSVGMTDLQAQIFAYAASRKFGSSIQAIPGFDHAAKTIDGTLERFGIDANVSVAEGAREKYYDQLHQHYMRRFGRDEALANETTDAVFNRLVNAGVAGKMGVSYLPPVKGLNMAMQSSGRDSR